MTLDGFWPVFGTGAVGCFALELLRWWRVRDEATNKLWPSSLVFYFFISLSMIGLSGLVATFHGIDGKNAFTVFQLGASVPAMLATFAAAKGGSGTSTFQLQGQPIKRFATLRDYVDFLAFRMN